MRPHIKKRRNTAVCFLGVNVNSKTARRTSQKMQFSCCLPKGGQAPLLETPSENAVFLLFPWGVVDVQHPLHPIGDSRYLRQI
jgi:hypothetical protein